MKWHRITVLIWRDYKIFLRSRWRWLEFFYFPITSLIIWGLFAVWTGEFAPQAGIVALVVNIFWSYAYTVQSTINLTMSEDAWAGVGSQLLVTGLTKNEYLFARILFGGLLSILNIALMFAIAQLLFYNVLAVIIPMLLLVGVAAIISIGLSALIAGLIFALGRKFMWLAWSALQFLILLSFPLSPVEILPSAIQIIAIAMPYTAFFQAVRALAMGNPWISYILNTLPISAVYLILGLATYYLGFERARKSGTLAKMF